MKKNRLGLSDLEVSELALGTMTFGEQNTEAEGHAQLDYALSRGINFIDTAEMYPVPGRGETQGRSEAIVGTWLRRQARDQLIIATKATGPARGFNWIRGGPKLNRLHLEAALHDSLQRLQTDYVDLYQLHWPDRYVPMFGEFGYEPARVRPTVPIEEQLAVLQDFVQAGKIRYVGLSNETPWGVMQFVRLADAMDLPRVISVQNAYHLLNRTFEMGLSETCLQEQVSLLAYSPLGFGVLSGKYLKGAAPAGSRLQLFPAFGQRYHKINVDEATAAYADLAQRMDWTPAQLALAFVRSRSFVASTIIGATQMQQLQENINSAALTLNSDALEAIQIIHQRYPNPAP